MVASHILVLLDFLDTEPGVEYIAAIASNSVLQRKAEQAMQYARILVGVTGQTEHVYGEAFYAAGSWKRERRMIIKAELVQAEGKELKDNPRLLITNKKRRTQRPPCRTMASLPRVTPQTPLPLHCRFAECHS
jgi:hypothetical protein